MAVILPIRRLTLSIINQNVKYNHFVIVSTVTWLKNSRKAIINPTSFDIWIYSNFPAYIYPYPDVNLVSILFVIIIVIIVKMLSCQVKVLCRQVKLLCRQVKMLCRQVKILVLSHP